MTRPMSQFAIRDGSRRARAVLAVAPPAADDVVSLVDLLEEQRDVGRVVLEVAVHRHDDAPLRVVESGRHRRRLAVVAAQLDDLESRVVATRVAQARDTCRLVLPSSTTMTSNDTTESVQRLLEARAELVDVVFLVMDGDDDREVDRTGRARRGRSSASGPRGQGDVGVATGLQYASFRG